MVCLKVASAFEELLLGILAEAKIRNLEPGALYCLARVLVNQCHGLCALQCEALVCTADGSSAGVFTRYHP